VQHPARSDSLLEDYVKNKRKKHYHKKTVQSLTMRELPSGDQPYEKAERSGIAALSDAELLSVILTSGHRGETALQTAQKALVMTGGVAGIFNASAKELQSIPGIGRVKSLRILAAAELGQRAVAARQIQLLPSASTADRVLAIVEPKMRYLAREEFHIILLDAQKRVLRTVCISKGGLTGTVIQPRDIFREAVKHNAAAMILAHNHPSGDASPSAVDIESTERFMKIGRMMGIPVLDHIIVGAESSVSMKRQGYM
jgi:DNA repair protein RadC